ncbi:hypothetical protein CJU81_17825 [Pseudomonas fragi]|uniref:Uncharacterized protein n=1 Tax=Pseudomonas fragi TaxID=296 RepID=A0A267A6H6_PSEFR|nr:hypothetical protein CJU81_17825 [Pseudomonas fragi]
MSRFWPGRVFRFSNGCGSGLARDAGDAVSELNRAEAIASKPAPTNDLCRVARRCFNPNPST